MKASSVVDPGSPDVVRSLIDACRGELLDYADNSEAFMWVEREGLRVLQQILLGGAALEIVNGSTLRNLAPKEGMLVSKACVARPRGRGECWPESTPHRYPL
jgi:hypothetical protein